jgi:pyruvate/2-oxoglutarate dehydrogenase complex dihydrolipoamide dehydrogenase (E3) component
VVGAQRIRARRFVVATGSGPAVPALDGLGQVPFLTNENIFDLTELPRHLIVLGGGPIGIEMAQAFRRLGARVTVLVRSRILPKDEPEAVAVLRAALLADGVELREHTDAAAVAPDEAGVRVLLDGAGDALVGSHLLVAIGRRPSLDGLGLAEAGVVATPQGIAVDAGLRSSNRRVFAIGDVAGGPQFTHIAGYHAGIVLRRARPGTRCGC